MKKLLILVAAMAMAISCDGKGGNGNGTDVPPPPVVDPTEDNGSNDDDKPGETLDNDATKRTMQMGLGWNLGNQLDAYEESPSSSNYLMPSETVWGNPKVTAQAIKKVREAGFTTIRIPVTWLAKIGPAPSYKIDAEWMARVTEVVGYALDAGFQNIIVDMHHDEDHVREVFSSLYDDYIAKNIPVYIGEIGCSRRAKTDARGWSFSLYYLEYVAKAARTYCLPAVLWDCGGKGVPGPEHHYYIRHDTGEYYPDAKEAVDVLIKGWFNEDPAYTLQSVYDAAPIF